MKITDFAMENSGDAKIGQNLSTRTSTSTTIVR
jgi:hypothetical protein